MKKILILASNPRKDLNLDKEIRDLKRVIESSRQGEDFTVVDELAVRVGDLQELMLKHRPQIVHFCGHGGGEQGLVFESDVGKEHLVRTEALANLFDLVSSNVECVLLNACYSEEQANAIVTHINYVIGMNQEIRDDAAIAFAKGFYRALGYALQIEEAFKYGCNAIQLEISGSSVVRSTSSDVARKLEAIDNVVATTAIPEHLKPILKKKPTLTSTPNPTLSQEMQRAIHLDINKSLEVNKSLEEDWGKQINKPLDIKLQRFEFDVITVDKKGNENSRTRKSAESFARDLGNGVSLDMVMIAGGTFQMGSPAGEGDDDERPQHSVTVPSFLMGKYAITQAQWRTVAALPQVAISLDRDPSQFKGDSRPVEQVSWDEAVEFCQRLSQVSGHPYRLPSEAEWEYACRAGTTTPYYFGETLTPKLARCKANLGIALVTLFSGETTAVGRYLPNAFGLYDMHGQVWEWCADCGHENYANAPTDGRAWLAENAGNMSNRVVRGGSWFNNPTVCRSANRLNISLSKRFFYLGFRVVHTLPPGQ